MQVTIDTLRGFVFEENDTALTLHPANAGQRTALGSMTIEEIDVLRDHPDVDKLTIAGLVANCTD